LRSCDIRKKKKIILSALYLWEINFYIAVKIN
jgi:hypothetical protein